MPVSFNTCLFVLSGIVAAVVATHAQGQSVAPAEKIVVSYPSKSITNFPILETARQKGFFQREGLHVSLVYIRGGLDIQTLLTNDADFAMGSTTAVTAFVAGAPLRIVLSYNRDYTRRPNIAALPTSRGSRSVRSIPAALSIPWCAASSSKMACSRSAMSISLPWAARRNGLRR